MPNPGPTASDELTLTLSEGITLSVAEAAPYGATLTEEFGVGGEDTGTLAEATTLTATLGDTDSGEITAPAGLPVYANAVYWTGADTGTLTDTAAATGAGPSGDGADTGTLSEGITLTVGETAAYGATLTETSAIAVPSTDTGTLADTAAVAADNLPLGSDTLTLSDNGTVVEGGIPLDAFTLSNNLVEMTVDDLVAEGTLAETVNSLTATTSHSDTAALSDNGVVVSDITTYATSGTDPMTLAEAVVLTVLAVASDTETLTENQPALALTHTDTVALTEAQASTLLATAAESGTLGESTVLTIGGGAVVVVVTATDTAALTDTGTVAGTLYGKPLGTVAVALRLDAAARIRRRIATTSDTALEPVPVGAGDIP